MNKSQLKDDKRFGLRSPEGQWYNGMAVDRPTSHWLGAPEDAAAFRWSTAEYYRNLCECFKHFTVEEIR